MTPTSSGPSRRTSRIRMLLPPKLSSMYSRQYRDLHISIATIRRASEFCCRFEALRLMIVSPRDLQALPHQSWNPSNTCVWSVWLRGFWGVLVMAKVATFLYSPAATRLFCRRRWRGLCSSPATTR